LKIRLLFCLLFLSLLVGVNKASAVNTYTWNTSVSSGNWNTASNWTIGGVTAGSYPGQLAAGDIVQVSSTATITYSGTSSANSIASLSILNYSNAVTLKLVNSTGAPVLTITGGINIQNYGTDPLSITATTTGTVNLNGVSSNLNNGNTFTIGSGVTVNLSSGYSFSLGGNFSNSGTLNVSGGSSFNVAANSTSFTNTGTITVAAAPSSTTNSTLAISGSVCAFNNTGGSISFTGLSTLPSSVFTLTANNSTFTNTGTITATDAPMLWSGTSIPVNNTSPGVITLIGPTSNTTALFTVTGNSSTFTNTGTINATYAPILFSGNTVSPINNTSPGKIYLTSSPLTVTSVSTFNNTGLISASASALNLGSGGLNVYFNNTSPGSLTLASSSTFNFPGNSTVNNGIFTNTGTVTVTSSNMNFTGNANTFTNTGTGSFSASGSALAFSDCTVTNSTSGGNTPLFTANGGSTMVFTNSSSFTNSGICNIGTSNSACAISTGSGVPFTLSNSGTFNLGSTSSITLSNTVFGQANTISNTGVFTLESDQYGSASFGQLSSSAGTSNSITGTYNVQRFLQGGATSTYRGYRLLSSPVNNVSATSSSGSNYINFSYIKASATVVNPNAIVGTTTYYGAFTGGTSTGFSIVNSNPTIYIYDEQVFPTQTTRNSTFISGKNIGLYQISGTSVELIYSYTRATTNSSCTTQVVSNNPSGTSYSIAVGNGYEVYFIGSTNGRASGSSATPPDNTTITNIGYINQQNVQVYPLFTQATGNLSYSSQYTCSTLYPNSSLNYQGYNMVGNPYPSSIDLNQVYTDNCGASRTNTNNNYTTFYEWSDVSQSYVSYNGSTGALGNPTYSSRYIASGQGFFVVATAVLQTLVFKEDQKATLATAGAPSNFLDAPGKQITSLNRSLKAVVPAIRAIQNTPANVLAGLHMMLKKDSTTFRECGIYFNNLWSDNYDVNDALDLDGANLAVYMSSFTADGVRVSINSMADYTKGKRVKLFVKATTDGLYHLNMEDIQNIDTATFNVYLIDNNKKDSLDLVHYQSYAFNIVNTDTTTYGANRFVLAIERKPLPTYQLVSFTAQKVSGGVLLTWKTNNEGDYTGFGVEKQQSGLNQYVTIDSVQSNGSGTYTYLDKAPAIGNNTYRLAQNNIDSLTSYTNPLNILYDGTTSGIINVYPNPAHESITVNFNSVTTTPDTYLGSIYNATGELMIQKTLSNNSWTQDVSSLKPGAYIVKVKSSNGNPIGNSKFIKYQ